jgi:ketosteroid isomerase-like protein
MSRESMEARGRDVFERVWVRRPLLADLAFAGGARLRPGSVLRRRLLRWRTERLFAAINRGDFDVVVLVYEPHAEVWTSGLDLLGIKDCYRGAEGVREYAAEFDDVFSEWSWTLRGVVDGGECLAIHYDLLGRGRRSGAETRVTSAGIAARMSDRGKIAWQHFFIQTDGWQEAIEAVGLRE